MRLIGMAERALELMCQRVDERVAFGRPLAEQGVVREWIAESRVRIEQARLLVLKTAWLMDTVGNKGAHTEIQAIKIATPQGRVGHRQGDPGARRRRGQPGHPAGRVVRRRRTLRLADGPDEVHKTSLAKRELRPPRRPAESATCRRQETPWT